MKITKYRVFWAWESEKEEQWLNKMSKRGFHLIKVGLFRYCFEEGIPGEYIYRLEMLPHFPGHPESISYIQFFEETGVQMMGSIIKWVYFRKKVTDRDNYFEIFSDIPSKVHHINRIQTLLIPCMILEFLLSIYNIGIGLLYKSSSNLLIAIPIFFFGIFIAVGIRKLFQKNKCLQKERAIHE